jgi:hypothetical protein
MPKNDHLSFFEKIKFLSYSVSRGLSAAPVGTVKFRNLEKIEKSIFSKKTNIQARKGHFLTIGPDYYYQARTLYFE